MKDETRYKKYGRCMIDDGTRCIRPRSEGSEDNYWCTYCQDDAPQWAIVPEEIWSDPKWQKMSDRAKALRLDEYVKANPSAWRKLHDIAANSNYW